MAENQFDAFVSDMSPFQWVNVTVEISQLFTDSERFVQMLSPAPDWRILLNGLVDLTEAQFPFPL